MSGVMEYEIRSRG